MKTKISVTVDQGRLAEAQQLSGTANTSALVDQALQAFIVAHLEQAHAEGYRRLPQNEEDMVALPDPSVWAGLWDEG
jgi:hypothetical protein